MLLRWVYAKTGAMEGRADERGASADAVEGKVELEMKLFEIAAWPAAQLDMLEVLPELLGGIQVGCIGRQYGKAQIVGAVLGNKL